MARKLITITVDQGDDYEIRWNREDGHMLYVGGEFRGCVGSIEEGRAYRDELVYDALMAEVA